MRLLLAVVCLAACGPSSAPASPEPEVFGVGTVNSVSSVPRAAPAPVASEAGAGGSVNARPVSSATPRPADLAPGVGWLPPEEIQRTVRQNFGRFRVCYERALQRNAALMGKVVVKFVINRDGAVGAVSRDEKTTMPDEEVVSCVVEAFRTITYPPPDGGIVTVVYPINFAPGS